MIVIALVVLAHPGSAHLESFKIVDPAMAPGLKPGQTVSVDRAMRSPGLGRIIVFNPPAAAMTPGAGCGARTQGAGHRAACDKDASAKSNAILIKRVVGLPGDVISIVDGHVIRNGSREPDASIRACGGPNCNFPKAITVPAGEYYVLGDNRAASDDSRFWGPVPRAWIIGTVVG
ncbi:MAG TPA: signal peptidase I [Solirubrobacteraceae bacterium]|nr:signal peptidase I [Solirubrobacteraceae bacterium]